MITFYQSTPPTIESFGKNITKNAFRQRLTFSERVLFKSKASVMMLTDPTPEQIQNAISLEVLQEDLANVSYADLSLPECAQAMGLLTATGILAPGRGDEILNNPVRWHELLTTAQEKFIEQYGLEACLTFDAALVATAEPVPEPEPEV